MRILSSSLLLCFAFSATKRYAAASSIDIIPNDGETVIFSDEVRDINSWAGEPVLNIKSNIPVTILRYNEGASRFLGAEPIDETSAYVYVKTNCPNLNAVNVVSNLESDLIHVKVKPSPSKRKFLPPSAFEANWSYTSGWCWSEQQQAQEELELIEPAEPVKPIEEQVEGKPEGESMVEISKKAEPSTRKMQEAVEEVETVDAIPEDCHFTVEVLIDGCTADLMVDARKMRLVDIGKSDEIVVTREDDECTTDYNALLVESGPVKEDRRRESRQEVMGIEKLECGTMVEGRPFVDTGDKLLFAKAHVASTPVWSEVTEAGSINNAQPHQPECIASSPKKNDVSTATPTSKGTSIGSTWAQRAIGEHASVASFASFTMDLMTNGAPPELIQDALTAALDEVNHAKTSFEVASLFAGRIIEPSALPSSQLSFDKNITRLALAAAREGCIDETISAVAAAVEADLYLPTNNTDIDADDAAYLREKLTGIALDEGRHSALAWRTVAWTCSVDQDACTAVLSHVLTSDNFEAAFKRRFGPSATLANKWNELHATLIPVVTSGATKSTPPISCSSEMDIIGAETKGQGAVVTLLLHNIIRDVVCRL